MQSGLGLSCISLWNNLNNVFFKIIVIIYNLVLGFRLYHLLSKLFKSLTSCVGV